jgi:hypothetical protein
MTSYVISLRSRDPFATDDLARSLEIAECGVRCAFNSFAQPGVILLAVNAAGAVSLQRQHRRSRSLVITKEE